MSMAPMLALPYFEQEFVVECDASKHGIGAVLMQQERPIAFYSTTLKRKNVFLSTYEKELLALAMVVQHWKPYLLGRRFRICTDHKSLKFLLEQQVTTEMQQKWIIKFMGYDFIIKYKQGKFNQVADGLSRKGEEVVLCVLKLPVPGWWNPVVEQHETNKEIQSLKEQIMKEELGDKWTIKKGVLLYKDLVYLPEDSDLFQ